MSLAQKALAMRSHFTKKTWRNLWFLGPPYSFLFHFFLFFPPSVMLTSPASPSISSGRFLSFFFFTSLIIWTFIEYFLYARHCSKTLPALSYSRPCHDGLNELCGMILATRNTGMMGPWGFRGLLKSLQLIWGGATLQTHLVCTQSPCCWSSLPRLSKWPP